MEIEEIGKYIGVQNGYAFKSAEFSSAGIPVVKIKNIVPPNVNLDEVNFVTTCLSEKLQPFIIRNGDILISMTGSGYNQMSSAVGKVGRYLGDELCLLNQRVGKIYSLDEKVLCQTYLYYFFSQKWVRYELTLNAGGSANQANISPKHIKSLEILLPEIGDQVTVSEILSTLDEKIELNRKQNQTLEVIAQTLFKRWFVEFEFPDEKGNPFKSNGGAMQPSELGEIPVDWSLGTLRDIANCFDSKRVPLSSRERAKRQGKYPYYGATSIMDYIDDYIFDGIYLLLGEDGSVMTESRNPYLQYVWGKIWVNNHAHVLQGKGVYTTEMLYLLLRKMDVSHIITGAVQLKINQSNLFSLELAIPDEKTAARYATVIDPIFSKIRTNSEQNSSLSRIRDSLLPKLMSGELRVA